MATTVFPVQILLDDTIFWLGWVMDEPGHDYVLMVDGRILWGRSLDGLKHLADERLPGQVWDAFVTTYDVDGILRRWPETLVTDPASVLDLWNVLGDICSSIAGKQSKFEPERREEYQRLFSNVEIASAVRVERQELDDADRVALHQVVQRGRDFLLAVLVDPSRSYLAKLH